MWSVEEVFYLASYTLGLNRVLDLGFKSTEDYPDAFRNMEIDEPGKSENIWSQGDQKFSPPRK